MIYTLSYLTPCSTSSTARHKTQGLQLNSESFVNCLLFFRVVDLFSLPFHKSCNPFIWVLILNCNFVRVQQRNCNYTKSFFLLQCYASLFCLVSVVLNQFRFSIYNTKFAINFSCRHDFGFLTPYQNILIMHLFFNFDLTSLFLRDLIWLHGNRTKKNAYCDLNSLLELLFTRTTTFHQHNAWSD